MKNFNICLELSILIPCYNSEKTLNRLFSSIARQKYPSKYLKIIVVNDGSTDTTSEILFK
jgi:glycosyltransferase involved in cell wall biosynthesis